MKLGMIGIDSSKKLPEPLPPNPKLHAFKQLPTRWDEVLLYIESESGDLLRKAMGEEFINTNIKVREYDIEHYFKLTLAEEIKDLTIRY